MPGDKIALIVASDLKRRQNDKTEMQVPIL